MYSCLSQIHLKEGHRLTVQSRRLTRYFGLHWHDYIELELIVGGGGQQRLNGCQYTLKRGSLCLLRFTDFHDLTPESELKILNLSVEESFLPKELLARLQSPKALVFQLQEAQTQTLERLLSLCMEENAREKPDAEYLQHLLSCVLLRVLRLVPEETAEFRPSDTPIGQALLYLQMHFRENPGLSRLSEIAHYNTSHFSTAFHRQTGLTYTQYLNKLKTDYAKTLLLSTQLGITEIWHECGFTSHSNFLRLFREETGLCPTAYRKSGHRRAPTTR